MASTLIGPHRMSELPDRNNPAAYLKYLSQRQLEMGIPITLSSMALVNRDQTAERPSLTDRRFRAPKPSY